MNPELVRLAATWLSAGVNGLGNAGDVRGKKVRSYTGDSFSHDFHGYEAARERFAKQFGEGFAEAPTPNRGAVGLVGEVNRNGQQCLVCEVFHLGTGESAMLVQPMRKGLLRSKAQGEPEILGPAPSLPYIPTPPELKTLIAALEQEVDARIAARSDATREIGIELSSYFSKRGGDDILWDFNLKVARGGKELEFWSKQIWDRTHAALDVEEFSSWLEQQLDFAMTL